MITRVCQKKPTNFFFQNVLEILLEHTKIKIQSEFEALISIFRGCELNFSIFHSNNKKKISRNFGFSFLLIEPI